MTAPSIKPIETRYAGCRFRSRLEARWAVFFDKLRIPWGYEPQGYTFDEYDYLPDFYLPDDEMFVEVKGSEADAVSARPKLKSFTRAIRRALLVLGEVPVTADNGLLPAHYLLTSESDSVRAGAAVVIAGDVSRYHFHALAAHRCTMTDSRYHEEFEIAPLVHDAYKAARSARFEHGESGAA